MVCAATKARWAEEKVVGSLARARKRYHTIAYRISHPELNRGVYAGIELRVTLEDFVPWFRARDFEGASVDRIDPKGHYELSNMQVIPHAVNVSKDKPLRIGADGLVFCPRCEKRKPVADFAKNKARRDGIQTYCRPCHSLKMGYAAHA